MDERERRDVRRSDDAEHDPEALERGAERMRATGHGDQDDVDKDVARDHDPEAVEEAAERMHTARPKQSKG